MVDYYGTNPLADLMAEMMTPARYAALASVAEPPKMLANGTADVPAFTRSGIDPQALLKLPLGMRHAAAENPDLYQVYQWFEEYAGVPDAKVDSAGLTQAEARMDRWVRDTPDPRPAEAIEAEAQAEYEQFERAMSPDGLLPEERQAQREAAWQAKQGEAAARQAAITAKAQARLGPMQPAAGTNPMTRFRPTSRG